MASQSDVPIVRRLEQRSDPSEQDIGLQPVQGREVVLNVQAESLNNMRQRATVRIEHPKGSTFQIICDEGPHLGGDDSAPPPLAYFSASIAFCLMTQLSRYASIKRLDIRRISLSQETRFALEGSVVKGTLAGRGLEVVTRVDIDSSESEETIRNMLEVGENSCFVLQSVVNAVPSRMEVTLNGSPIVGSSSAPE